MDYGGKVGGLSTPMSMNGDMDPDYGGKVA